MSYYINHITNQAKAWQQKRESNKCSPFSDIMADRNQSSSSSTALNLKSVVVR